MRYNIPTDFEKAHLIKEDCTINLKDVNIPYSGPGKKIREAIKDNKKDFKLTLLADTVFSVKEMKQQWDSTSLIIRFVSGSAFLVDGTTIPIKKDFNMTMDSKLFSQIEFENIDQVIIPNLSFGRQEKGTSLGSNIFLNITQKYIEYYDVFDINQYKLLTNQKNILVAIASPDSKEIDKKYKDVRGRPEYRIYCDLEFEPHWDYSRYDKIYDGEKTEEKYINKIHKLKKASSYYFREKIGTIRQTFEHNKIFKVMFIEPGKDPIQIAIGKTYTGACRKADFHNNLNVNPTLVRKIKLEKVLKSLDKK